MRRVAAVAALALVVAGGGAFAFGLGPAPGGDAGDESTAFPTATPTATATTTPTAAGTVETRPPPGTTETTAPRPAFAFAVDSTEACGRTCRDVTSTLSNTGDADATGVTVFTRIYVGQEAGGDVAWEGRESVGALPAGKSYTTTRRVALGLAEAAAVQNAGGWITVQTTVRSDQRTVTFAEPRRVA